MRGHCADVLPLHEKTVKAFFFFSPGGADASGGWKPLSLLLFKNVVQSLENYFGPIFLLFDENKILVRVI